MTHLDMIAISIIGAMFWFFFVIFIFHVKQGAKSQVRRRVEIMIMKAEAERAQKAAKIKKDFQQAEALQARRLPQNNFYTKVISPIFDKVDKHLQKFVPAQMKSALEERIFRAGKASVWSLTRVVSFCFLTTTAGALTALLITNTLTLTFAQKILIVLAGAFFGAMLPIVRLNAFIRKRQKIIRRSLPEFLDLLCVSVQAGLSFDGAVAKITERMSGPLVDEFKKMQNDIGLGMTRQYALNQIARRCDLEEIYLFTSSVIQAEKLGTSMGRTLKMQADNMRERHRQFVKAEALKAPIKIIFPMVLFIFPSVFVVLLMPAILNLMKNLAK